MISKFKTTLVLLLLVMASFTQARTLPQILRAAVGNNPKLSEAHANERIAGTQLEQTAAARWPVIAATGGQRVVSSNSNSSGFTPALQGKWTIYDFGKNDAQIDSNLLKVDYFTNKTQETAEELIYEIAGYYLDALKSKNSLKVANGNLKRHHELVRMLKVIVKYDPGRRSELTQAKSRLLQVESDITNYQRSLGLSLLRIAPHIKPAVTADEITDPFKTLKPKKLIAKYRNSAIDLQSHPSYLAQQKEMLRIAADLVVAKKARWPDINLIGAASTSERSVYLNFDVDIFNRTIDPGLSEKRYEIEAAQAQLEQIQRNLDERAKLAELKMFQDQTRLYIADNQIKELAQVARDYEDQFSIAKRTLLDVVNAYRELAGIELFKVNTRYDLMVAKLDYLSAVGALREWANVNNNERHPLLIADTQIKTIENIENIENSISLKALDAKPKKPLLTKKGKNQPKTSKKSNVATLTNTKKPTKLNTNTSKLSTINKVDSSTPTSKLNKVATLNRTYKKAEKGRKPAKSTTTKNITKTTKKEIIPQTPVSIKLESFNGAMASITDYAKSQSSNSNISLESAIKQKNSKSKVATSTMNKKATAWKTKTIIRTKSKSDKIGKKNTPLENKQQPIDLDIDLESLTEETVVAQKVSKNTKTKKERIVTRPADNATIKIIRKAERAIANEKPLKKIISKPRNLDINLESAEILDIKIDLESSSEEADLQLINLESLNN